MNVSDIITLSRDQTGTTAGQISDTKYLQYLNIVYKDVFHKLAIRSKKYTRQSYTTDIVADQSEYIIPKPTTNQTGLNLVLDVFYKGERIKTYDTEISNKLDHKDQFKPYGIIRDGSIFIYPTPTKDIAGGLVLQGKYIPQDLVLTDTSDEIKLDEEEHNTLIEGLNALIFGAKQVYDKQQLWKSYYEESIRGMDTSDNESGYEVIMPNLYRLE